MHFKFSFIFNYLIFINLTTIESANILSIFGYPGEYQYAFVEPLLKKLAERGHHVTSISNYPQKRELNNFRDLVIEENQHLFDNFLNFTMSSIDLSYHDWMDKFYTKTAQLCENVLKDTEVRKLLIEEKFDLILLDLFMAEAFFGLGEMLQAPIIGVSIMGTYSAIDNVIGNISPVSYIPNMVMNIKFSDTMNFWQRVLNVMITALDHVYYTWKYLPKQKNVYEKYFPNATLGFYEAQKNISLIFVNDHFTLNYPRPYVTNMIEVAGMDLNENIQEIPNDLKQLLDNAKNGIIYMKINWSNLKIDKLQIFLRQIGMLKQIILWKTPIAAEIPVAIPSNIYVDADFPQTAILAHPNTKLFVCQGCTSSIIESIYYAKPILGLMCAKSQEDYVDHVAKMDNGISIKCETINDKSLHAALQEVLYNPRYRQIAETLSFRFRDQQIKPMDRAIYWVEYVLRHGGAAHLQNKGRNLSLMQFYNIDVYLLVVAVFGIFIYLTNFVINLIRSKMCSIKNIDLSNKKNK